MKRPYVNLSSGVTGGAKAVATESHQWKQQITGVELPATGAAPHQGRQPCPLDGSRPTCGDAASPRYQENIGSAASSVQGPLGASAAALGGCHQVPNASSGRPPPQATEWRYSGRQAPFKAPRRVCLEPPPLIGANHAAVPLGQHPPGQPVNQRGPQQPQPPHLEHVQLASALSEANQRQQQPPPQQPSHPQPALDARSRQAGLPPLQPQPAPPQLHRPAPAPPSSIRPLHISAQESRQPVPPSAPADASTLHRTAPAAATGRVAAALVAPAPPAVAHPLASFFQLLPQSSCREPGASRQPFEGGPQYLMPPPPQRSLTASVGAASSAAAITATAPDALRSGSGPKPGPSSLPSAASASGGGSGSGSEGGGGMGAERRRDLPAAAVAACSQPAPEFRRPGPPPARRDLALQLQQQHQHQLHHAVPSQPQQEHRPGQLLPPASKPPGEQQQRQHFPAQPQLPWQAPQQPHPHLRQQQQPEQLQRRETEQHFQQQQQHKPRKQQQQSPQETRLGETGQPSKCGQPGPADSVAGKDRGPRPEASPGRQRGSGVASLTATAGGVGGAPSGQAVPTTAAAAVATGSNGGIAAELPNPSPSNTMMPPIEKLKRPLRMALSEWIPHAGVVAAFETKGVTKLYPWQAAALECGEDGHNLVYCAPTSGGKSLVAEVLMIRRLIAAQRARQQRQQQSRGSRAAAPLAGAPRALLVLPYVSIVSEKAEHLTRMLGPLRGKVRGYTGTDQTGAPLSAPDEMVAVVTMEKANSTVNRMMAEGRLGDLCCVVVDEAHMVGDPNRGICLELCLTKLRFAAAAAAAATAGSASTGSSSSSSLSCQLVCMSATMSGLDHMCGWLGARLFMTNFRPVPLTEYAVFKGKVFRKLTKQEMEQKAAALLAQQQQQQQQHLQQEHQAQMGQGQGQQQGATGNPSAATAAAPTAAAGPAKAPATASSSGFTIASATASAAAAGTGSGGGSGPAVEPLVEERELPDSCSKDPDRLVPLVAEVAREGHSTLVFCATRKACEGCAGMLSDLLPKQLPPVSPDTFRARRALLAELQDASGGYLSQELQKLIEAGVAYHHAGLTSQERAAVEKGFRGGLIHTLTATSTLAAGINLPARRVILRSLWQGVGPVSRAQYLQMIGRAGRAGQSPIGEAFLIGKGAPHTLQGDWRDVCRLMTARLPPLRCCLLDVPASASSDDGGTGAGAAGKRAAGGGGTGVKGSVAGRSAPSSEPQPGGEGGGGVGLAKGAGGAAAGGPAPSGGDGGGSGETHLQRMLLEAISNGSVATGAAVEALIRSTLLYQQAGYEQIATATHTALAALRLRRLVTFRPPTPKQVAVPPATAAATAASGPRGGSGRGPQAAATTAAATAKAGREFVPSTGTVGGAVGAGGGAGAQWQPTQMGRAIYDSCLPTAQGQDLYDRLTRALEGLVLEGGLHLLFLMLTEPLPVEIADWEVWAKMLERMPKEPHTRVGEALGVSLAYAQRLAAGRRGSAEESGRHSRFASAVLVHDLLCEGDPHELEEAWGRQGGLTKNGVSRGQLQKLQSDLSKWAGMAAVMAGSCGWWALQALLEGLSQQAAAGVRPELLPLMALPGMTGGRARALFAAGITKPALLAVASEDDVKKAIASSLPRALRQPKPGKAAKDAESAAAAAAAASSGNAVVARGARALIAGARQHLADVAARVAQEELDMAAAERLADGGAGGAGDEAARAAARRAALETAARLAAELRAAGGGGGGCSGSQGVAAGGAASASAGGVPATATAYRGSARITELSDSSSPEAVEAFLQAWRAKQCFSLAVISSAPLELEPEQRRLQQLHLGVVPARAGSAAAGPICMQAADADGSRPSAVDAKMNVPGPPPAAMARQLQQQQQQPPAGGPGRSGDAADGEVADGEVAATGAERRRGEAGSRNRGGRGGYCAVEGLAVAWDHMEAVVLTFHQRSRAPRQPTALPAAAAAGGGCKRKAQAQPVRRPKRGGAAVAADAFAAGSADDADAGAADIGDGDGVAWAAGGGVARGSASALWRAACAVLGAAGSSKVCWHAEAQLAALMDAGCEPAGQWDDPRVMAWLAQGTAGPQDLTLQELQRALLPAYAVRVPLQHRAAATAACRSALVAWALAAPLRAMLATEGVAAHYRLVEAPLTLALARTRLHLLPPTSPSTSPQPSDLQPGQSAAQCVNQNPSTSPAQDTRGTAAPGLNDASTAAALGTAAGVRDSCNTDELDGGSGGSGGTGGVVVDEVACRCELSRARAAIASSASLVSELNDGRAVDLSQPAALEALCARKFLTRRAGGGTTLPPELLLAVPVGRRPPRSDVFFVRAPQSLPPRDRDRAAALAMLLTRGSAAAAMAAVLGALLDASSAVAAASTESTRGTVPPPQAAAGDMVAASRGAGRGQGPDTKMAESLHEPPPGREPKLGPGTGSAGTAAGDATFSGSRSAAAPGDHGRGAMGAGRFALHRVGVEGRLGCVFSGEDDTVVDGPVASAADCLVVVTELSSAPMPGPSLQQQYCGSADGEMYLQSLLPLPVFFLDAPAAPADVDPDQPHHQQPHQQHPYLGPSLLRPGLLLELQGPGPCVTLQFGGGSEAQEGARSPGRCSMAVVAATDPLTRQPLHLALPTSRVWCARSCCGPHQCRAAARAEQLLTMATPQLLRCPAEEFLVPPDGWTFVTVLYPYLHLAVVAHCTGDERLVEALYQPQPWAAVAATWQESQAEHLRRLLPPPRPAGSAAAGGAGGGLCSPPPLELAARQVLSRALLGGCSHKELAAALGLTAGGAGGKVAAAALVSSFLEAFPGVAQHRQELLVQAKKDGYVALPSGARLRPATRLLTAGGVAAGAKLQRAVCRMQLTAAAAEVVRTAAALALQRAQRAVAEAGAAATSPPPPPAGGAAPVAASPSPPPRAVSLVWCSDAQTTLCVPRGRLGPVLSEVQEGASGGVMGQLGLRVPLHVSIYFGRSLELLRCQQFIPGADADGAGE